ncbi:MAG: YIP1 family protein [Candidatus Thermoplasmatota archaeon]|nr:YIP1 family protein [Candidatus Thermoplasmatota archaeon]
MDIMKTVNQAKDLVFNPKGTMEKLKNEQVELKEIIIYLAIVGVPTFLGLLLGYGFIWGGGGSLIGYAFAIALITYIMSIVGVIVFGFILNALAPSFKTQQNKMQALKLVSYAATPWLLLGIANIFPAAGLISLIGGLYGLYILYLGIPILMGTQKEQQMSFFIVGLIVYIVVMGVIYWLTSWIWMQLVWQTVWGGYGYLGGYRPWI